MTTKLTQAPAEPTNGDVSVAIETLRNAGAVTNTRWVNEGRDAILTLQLTIKDAGGDS